MNCASTSNERLSSESVGLDLDIEEENVEEQIIEHSNVDEVPAYPRDNPWITVTEEETGTKPPLLLDYGKAMCGDMMIRQMIQRV